MALYYYKNIECKLIGPLSEIQILDLRDAGGLLNDTPVCQAETEIWRPLVELNLQRPQLPARTYLTWLSLLCFCFIGIFVFLYSICHYDLRYHELSTKAGNNSTANTPPSDARPGVLSPDEIQNLRAAREVALQSDAELMDGYKTIIVWREALDGRFDADLIRVDSDMVTIVAKFKKLRWYDRDPLGSRSAGDNQIVITPREMKKLQVANYWALQSDPDLITYREKLMERIRAFVIRLDAAEIKVEPAVAPIIFKIEAGPRGLEMAVGLPPDVPVLEQ